MAKMKREMNHPLLSGLGVALGFVAAVFLTRPVFQGRDVSPVVLALAVLLVWLAVSLAWELGLRRLVRQRDRQG